MKSRDDFEGWLMFMEDAIQQLMDELPSDVAQRLDYSPQSLSVLEQWLLTRYESTKSILRETENFLLDRLARYVGETVRRNVPSTIWGIELEKEDYVFYGLPILRHDGNWEECPASLVTASLDRRTGTYMEKIVTNLMRR